jgi:hypothetical protein
MIIFYFIKRDLKIVISVKRKSLPKKDLLDYLTEPKHNPICPQEFQNIPVQTEHNGQHSDCPECQDVAVPLIKMMNNPLPRGDKDKSATLPQRSLGPGNHTPSFKNNLVADLDFIQYRKADAEKSQDIVRLQNYANYQSVCLAQNIDDMAQDIVQTKTHMNGLHSEIDNLENNQETLKSQLVQILEKLETIQTTVQSLKDSFDKEKEPSSPIRYSELEKQASYKWFGAPSTSKGEQKHLTLKQLATEHPNPILARIAQVVLLASEKLELVKSQSSSLEEEIHSPTKHLSLQFCSLKGWKKLKAQHQCTSFIR